MKIKITLRLHLMPIGMVIVKRKQKEKINAGDDLGPQM